MNSYTLLAVLAVLIGSSMSFGLDQLAENINDERIVGGSTARPGQFPYMASIRARGRFPNGTLSAWKYHCGGSIISNRWVVSAAACTYLLGPQAFRIYVGAHHLHNDGRGYLVDRVTIHPR